MTLGHAGQRRGRHRRGAGADDARPDSGQYGAGLSAREYFWLAILGLTLIASLSSGNVLKGLMEGAFGLLLAMIRVGMGVLGWLLGLAGSGPSPIVLGLVLGQIAGQGFMRAHMIAAAGGGFGGQLFFDRPISWAIVRLILATPGLPLWRHLAQRLTDRRETPP